MAGRCTDGEADGGLAAAVDRASQQQIRDIGAGDQQHDAADGQQDLKAATVSFFHDGDAGSRGNDVDDLLGQQIHDVGRPVWGIAGLVLHPLAEDAGEARSDSGGGSSGAETADDAKPSSELLMHERGIATNDGFLLEGNPDVGRIAAQGLAEEAGWSDADDGEGMALDHKRGTEDGGVAGVGGLPGAMTENSNRGRGGRVVIGCEDAARERTYT